MKQYNCLDYDINNEPTRRDLPLHPDAVTTATQIAAAYRDTATAWRQRDPLDAKNAHIFHATDRSVLLFGEEMRVACGALKTSSRRALPELASVVG